jgi:ATP-dependent helicase/nuclease subunit A
MQIGQARRYEYVLDAPPAARDTGPMNHISPVARAEHEQLQASDPAVSAFVSAHAGAGKTKLLVDRLLRLMLAGADPARILCLTYTKAAAAEMAIRLQRRLGGFVTLDDAALDRELAALAVARSADSRALARALFAKVLDLPGGMRISTIHAFCQSLLRRFPLEAQVSPHFALVEDADARAALEEAREAALPVADKDALATLAGLVNADGFAGLVAYLEREREKLQAALKLAPDALAVAMRRAAGVTAPDEASLLAGAVTWPGEARLRGALTRVQTHGSQGVGDKAGRMLGWLNLPAAERVEHWERWLEELFTKAGEDRKAGAFINASLAKTHTDVADICADEQARVKAVLDEAAALRMANASAALLTLAAPILQSYEADKSAGARLDYIDLIGRTSALLKDTGAAWVLFKLDGGLDHLLLDEVQDTAPEQWRIAARLTGDFFAGAGARAGTHRTVFAVGDVKQSIYSFQGAEPAAFAKARDWYRRRVEAAGEIWRETVLDVSFRSTAPVLDLVDAVFAEAPAANGVCVPADLHHVANRVGHAGAVEIWPLAPRPDVQALDPWSIAERNHGQDSAPDRLVRELAAWITAQVSGSVMLESAGRPLRPGDILVLVRRRNNFGRALVRALKAAGVPVAGLDRMVLTDQPAVQDLMSLCDALLLPDDDLTFCEFLVSPLGFLSDDSLMRLVTQRQGSAWEALRARAHERPEWQAAHDMFSALLSRVDFASPYALLSEVLGELGGRARLFARLGPEAAEPVDELLSAALHYAGSHPPSLQGFLHWLRQSGAEVKREAEAAGDVVRIMTVHGAKGLEAPLVILPDTVTTPPDDARLHWTKDPETGAVLPLWAPNKAFRCAAIEHLRAAEAAGRAEEYNRLLYVALTRARDRLLVCGWQTRNDVSETSWYALIGKGIGRLAPESFPVRDWGDGMRIACPQTAAVERAQDAVVQAVDGMPWWAGRAPDWRPDALPAEPVLPRPLTPSRPEGIELGPVPPARSPLGATAGPERFRRGLIMHSLLQHLPGVPPDLRAAAATAYAVRQGASADEAAALSAQATRVLAHPDLAPLFGPGSRAEQPVAGVVNNLVVAGQVDRFAVTPDRVLIADYKTNRMPPADAASVPVLYLRQMAAYRAILRLLYPDRPVICVLIWTEGPGIMPLPGDLLDRHAPGIKA